ncbi:uncharacterized protein LOC129588798 [Paramacrobiotus metropolitanus]|uniref:uncharacterized protein LOC129588798 n=1 Tax=Paramacrobiotus metropolitanus TaxID=2943436 RepID=UPI00244631F7|nr:uncharacterized protein LOC129588798 [Paramacrobiotus metropolitanus]
MHLYDNGIRSLYTWNSVDVELDGMLQHGYVIGLEDVNGVSPRMIVDFECPTHRSVPVEYGKVLDCSNKLKVDEMWMRCSDASDIEVLMRDQPNRPWKWYPGKVLIPSFDGLPNYALVEVLLTNYKIRELLPHRQMRLPLSGGARQLRVLQTDHYVVLSSVFPKGCWNKLEPTMALQVRREIQRIYWLHIVSVSGETLTYLQGRFEKSPPEEDMVKTFASCCDRVRKDSEGKVDAGKQDNDAKRRKTVNHDAYIWALPPELLREIFHSMDTIDRLRCQRTCHL